MLPSAAAPADRRDASALCRLTQAAPLDVRRARGRERRGGASRRSEHAAPSTTGWHGWERVFHRRRRIGGFGCVTSVTGEVARTERMLDRRRRERRGGLCDAVDTAHRGHGRGGTDENACSVCGGASASAE